MVGTPLKSIPYLKISQINCIPARVFGTDANGT